MVAAAGNEHQRRVGLSSRVRTTRSSRSPRWPTGTASRRALREAPPADCDAHRRRRRVRELQRLRRRRRPDRARRVRAVAAARRSARPDQRHVDGHATRHRRRGAVLPRGEATRHGRGRRPSRSAPRSSRPAPVDWQIADRPRSQPARQRARAGAQRVRPFVAAVVHGSARAARSSAPAPARTFSNDLWVARLGGFSGALDVARRRCDSARRAQRVLWQRPDR